VEKPVDNVQNSVDFTDPTAENPLFRPFGHAESVNFMSQSVGLHRIIVSKLELCGCRFVMDFRPRFHARTVENLLRHFLRFFQKSSCKYR